MPALKPAGAFALLCVACLTIMVGCVIVPGLPGIAAGLEVPLALSGWLVTLPSLGVVLFGPVAGLLITRHGSRRALRAGLILYGALGLAGIWLRGPSAVFADRLLLGGATAVVMSAGTSLISEFYEGRARLTMIARQGMAIELGGVVFLAAGGLLASLGWQWPFLLYLAAWLFLALVEAAVPEPPRPQPGTVESIASESGTRTVREIYFFALLSMVVFFAAIILLPTRLQAMGVSEAATGYFLSFVSLIAVGAAFLLPRVSARMGDAGTLMLGFACYAVAHASFALAGAFAGFLFGAILLGCGFGLTVPLVNHMTVERSRPDRRGQNLAYLSMAIFLGQFLSSFVNVAVGTGPAAFAAAVLLALTGTAAAVVLKAKFAPASLGTAEALAGLEPWPNRQTGD